MQILVERRARVKFHRRLELDFLAFVVTLLVVRFLAILIHNHSGFH